MKFVSLTPEEFEKFTSEHFLTIHNLEYTLIIEMR